MIEGLAFHHKGLAVKNKEGALKFLECLGYSFSEVIFDPLQGVDLIFCEHPKMPAVELVFNESGSSIKSPLGSILKGASERIYHICYSTNDIDATVEKIKDLGMRIIPISTKKPAILFNGKLVAFYMIAGYGIVEFLEISGDENE